MAVGVAEIQTVFMGIGDEVIFEHAFQRIGRFVDDNATIISEFIVANGYVLPAFDAKPFFSERQDCVVSDEH